MRVAGGQLRRGRDSVARRDSLEPAGSTGALTLLVVDEHGVIAFVDGSALETAGVGEGAIGERASKVLAGWPALRGAVEAAVGGRRSMVVLSAADRVFEVTVDTRARGGAVVAALDVTARQGDVRQGRDHELSLVFREVPGAVWSTDRDLIVTRAFGRVPATVGLDATTIVGASVQGVVGTDDPANPAIAAHRAALSGRRTSYRLDFRGRQFAIITEPLYDHPLPRATDAADASRPIVGTVSAAVDVTGLVEAEERLARAASLLQASLEATADGILVVDTSGRRITAYNQRFLEMWSVPTAIVSAGDDAALLAYASDQVEDPAGFLQSVRDLYAHPDKESFDVIRFRDGRVLERFSRPQRLGGEIVGRVWSFRDVTERERQFREAVFLSDATRLLSTLDVDQALASVAHLSTPYMADSCAIDLLVDGAPKRLMAVSSREPDRGAPELSPSVLSGRPRSYVVGARAHMAVPLVVGGVVTGAITFAAPPGRRYSARDLELAGELARRASLAVEKAHLLQRAQDALRAREELLAIAAHEIRGPVTALHAAVQALRRKHLSEASSARALELIEREDKRLARFVDELLDLGLMRRGEPSFDLEEVSLPRVVRDVVSSQAEELARSGSTLTTDLDERAVGMWHTERLQKVVAALLSNAVKFGLGKPIEISVRVVDERAVLEVVDHGIGVSPDAQKRIFAPFERAVSVRHYGGLGLGLFIASSIVKTLDGRISVASEPGVGTTFSVELPMGGSR